MLQHESFVTTSARGLDRSGVPMRLFEKAKRLGIWNPSEIDFAQDAADWQRLTDRSPAAQLRASVTYNMIVEGVLAETGYHAYLSALERNDLLPGQCRGIRLVKQDESRHIAYGIFLIARLLAADPDLWEVAEVAMNELLP